MRQWEQTFRSTGREDLLDMGCKRSYDWDTKVAAASAVVDSGRSKPDVMSSVGLSSVAHAYCLQKTTENGIPLKSSDSDPNPNDRALRLISRLSPL